MPSESEPELIVRADASTSIGLGHVMRCFALAEAWRDAGSTVTFMGAIEPASASLIDSAGFSIQPLSAAHPDPGDLAALIERVRLAAVAAWVVLDGYHFTAAYESAVSHAGARIIALDDEDARDRYVADIILNQNLHASALAYAGASGSIVLAGPRYALVRRELRDRGARHLRGGAVKRMVVLAGGADPAGISSLVLEALSAHPSRRYAVTLVIGPVNAAGARLRAEGESLGIDVHVNPSDLASRMAEADMAIAASGSTAWELSYLGVPAIYLSAAANQAPLGIALQEFGAGMYLGRRERVSAADLAAAIEALAADDTTRARMSEAGMALIDGDGALRVRRVARALDDGGVEPEIRRVGPDDSRAIWRLANDPDVRARSFARAPISFASHEQWFAVRMAAGDERFWAADVAGAILGHVRYTRAEGGMAEVHFTVARPARGRGIASLLLSRTAPMAARELGVTRFTGVASADNIGSHRAFEKAGYRRAGAETIHGRACVRFERTA